VLSQPEAAAIEAALDPRVATASAAGDVSGFDSPEEARLALEEFTTGRRIEWASRTLTQGEVLAAFARHCAEELDDVDVVEAALDRLVLRWRRETSRIELRAGFAGVERLASETPTLLLGDLGAAGAELVERFVDDAELRSRLAVCDLERLEKVGAVRSSVFVYFEWFLRDEYGVKLLPAAAFTQGLVNRGVISLGMG
jgi:hypothetical protein